MKFFAYIYIKNNVLRTKLLPNPEDISMHKEVNPLGCVFVIALDKVNEETITDYLERVIQEMMCIVKIVYRHYFFLRRHYDDILRDEVLYKALQEVSKEYGKRTANFD